MQTVSGFEDIWHLLDWPNRRKPETLLSGLTLGRARPDRLVRLAAGARETVVIFTGAPRNGTRLRQHLNYISRQGALALEDQDGFRLQGRAAMAELAEDWNAMAQTDSRIRDNMPLSRSMIFSMPPGTNREAFSAAVRQTAQERLGRQFDFAWLRHDDAPHPHAHLVVRAQGEGGVRFTPRLSDGDLFRETFAASLREHGVMAEATHRVVRGVTRKSEQHVLRRMRERYEAGDCEAPRTLRSAYLEASETAFDPSVPLRPWELQISQTQSHIRGLYLRQAKLLADSSDEDDRRLAKSLQTFVSVMPRADTRRLEMARQLRELADQLKERAAYHRTLIR